MINNSRLFILILSIICNLYVSTTSFGPISFTHKKNREKHSISLNKLSFYEKKIIYKYMLEDIKYVKSFF